MASVWSERTPSAGAKRRRLKVHVTGNHFTGQGVYAIRNNDGWTGSVRAEKNYYGGGPSVPTMCTRERPTRSAR